MKGTVSMRKRMFIAMLFGVICLIVGAIMVVLHVTPEILPVTIVATGSAIIAVFVASRGGTLIRDEMVKLIDVLSGSYTSTATFYLIFVLAIVNFIHPLLWSTSTLLLILMLYMSFSYILIRAFLLRRGRAE